MKRIPLPLLLLAAVVPCMASGIQIQTKAVPNGILKDAYYGVITASGGCTPYKWAIASGKLPAGITMSTSSDTRSVTLSGVPTAAYTYSFTVSAKGCGGHVSQLSYKVVIQKTENHVVDLSWQASTTSDVVGYNVYRGPDGKSWRKINSSVKASTVYTDSTTANSTTYYYATTAVDSSGNESKKSNIVHSTIP